MKQAIADYCVKPNQRNSCDRAGEFARCIFESLAFLYRQTLEALTTLTGRQYKRIHIVGGGSKNDFLSNQLCADFSVAGVTGLIGLGARQHHANCAPGHAWPIAKRFAILIRGIFRTNVAPEPSTPKASNSTGIAFMTGQQRPADQQTHYPTTRRSRPMSNLTCTRLRRGKNALRPRRH